MSPVDDLIIMNKSDRADEALRQMYQRNKNRVYVGSNLNKNKMINGHTMQPLSSTSSPGYDQFIKVNLEGIISKTDLLNIARNDEKSQIKGK